MREDKLINTYEDPNDDSIIQLFAKSILETHGVDLDTKARFHINHMPWDNWDESKLKSFINDLDSLKDLIGENAKSPLTLTIQTILDLINTSKTIKETALHQMANDPNILAAIQGKFVLQIGGKNSYIQIPPKLSTIDDVAKYIHKFITTSYPGMNEKEKNNIVEKIMISMARFAFHFNLLVHNPSKHAKIAGNRMMTKAIKTNDATAFEMFDETKSRINISTKPNSDGKYIVVIYLKRSNKTYYPPNHDAQLKMLES